MASRSWLILGSTLDNQQVRDRKEIKEIRVKERIMPADCMMEQEAKRKTHKGFNR